jgi:AmmeMemoRadiSam system protein B
MFFPAAPDALSTLITDARKRARPDSGVAPRVVIAPHARFVYSGAVAAIAFGAWARRPEPPWPAPPARRSRVRALSDGEGRL